MANYAKIYCNWHLEKLWFWIIVFRFFNVCARVYLLDFEIAFLDNFPHISVLNRLTLNRRFIFHDFLRKYLYIIKAIRWKFCNTLHLDHPKHQECIRPVGTSSVTRSHAGLRLDHASLRGLVHTTLDITFMVRKFLISSNFKSRNIYSLS